MVIDSILNHRMNTFGLIHNHIFSILFQFHHHHHQNMSFLHRVSRCSKTSFSSRIPGTAVYQSWACNPLEPILVMVSCGLLFPLFVAQLLRMRIHGVSNSELFCGKTGPCFWLKTYSVLIVLPTRTNLLKMHCCYFCTGIVISLDSADGILDAFYDGMLLVSSPSRCFESDDCVVVRILKFEVMEYSLVASLNKQITYPRGNVIQFSSPFLWCHCLHSYTASFEW